MAEVRVSGDVDMILIGQDASIVLPVREARAELSREFTRECMEGIENERVRGGGGRDAFGERGVNEVDDESIREEDDILVVSVSGRNMVRASGEGIRGREVFAQDMGKVEIKLGEI